MGTGQTRASTRAVKYAFIGGGVSALGHFQLIPSALPAGSCPLRLESGLDGLSPPQILPGPNEARLGFDTGVTAWLLITQSFRVYAAYDGRFRDGFESHSGSFGVDLRW